MNKHRLLFAQICVLSCGIWLGHGKLGRAAFEAPFVAQGKQAKEARPYMEQGSPGAESAASTGWISDEACGAEHTKPGRADCVLKCWRGGASVGHPEWKPQRAVFVADDTKTIWIVENPEAVKDFPAAHVRVTAKFDAAKKSLQVERIEAVK